jgi:hypothetical protein
MTTLLDVETWAVVGSAVFVAAAVIAIRLGWRRGKRLGDR